MTLPIYDTIRCQEIIIWTEFQMYDKLYDLISNYIRHNCIHIGKVCLSLNVQAFDEVLPHFFYQLSAWSTISICVSRLIGFEIISLLNMHVPTSVYL